MILYYIILYYIIFCFMKILGLNIPSSSRDSDWSNKALDSWVLGAPHDPSANSPKPQNPKKKKTSPKTLKPQTLYKPHNTTQSRKKATLSSAWPDPSCGRASIAVMCPLCPRNVPMCCAVLASHTLARAAQDRRGSEYRALGLRVEGSRLTSKGLGSKGFGF